MIHHYRNLEWKKSFQLRSLDKVPESGMQKKKKKEKETRIYSSHRGCWNNKEGEYDRRCLRA